MSKTIRLLKKSTSHTKPLEIMVNNLLATNGQITEKMMNNTSKITELEDENKVLANQRKANRDVINNLNTIIKGGC